MKSLTNENYTLKKNSIKNQFHTEDHSEDHKEEDLFDEYTKNKDNEIRNKEYLNY